MTGPIIILAHGLGGHAGEPLSAVAALGLAVAAALPPLALGLWLARSMAARAVDPLVRGMAGGALLFLFLDLALLSANLGMGLGNVPLQLALVAMFGLGLLGPARWAEQAPAWGWAVGVGLHTLGEGLVMGYNLSHGLESALRVLPLLSFVLHKVAEGWTMGLLMRPQDRLLPLALAAGLPIAIGALLGTWKAPGLVGNFIYAAGTGALAWALTHFLAPGGRRHATGMVLGLVVLYLVGWLHEF